MTSGAPAALATTTDIVNRWRPLTTDELAKAGFHLGDASAIVRNAIPDIDDRIAASPALGVAVLRVVVEAVLRVMRNPNGAKRIQEQIGDRGYTLDLPTAERSGLFISDDELAPLQPNAGGDAGPVIGTVFAGTRPGWSPERARPGVGDPWYLGG